METFIVREKTIKHKEAILDARMCEISNCPLFKKLRHPRNGQWVGVCKANMHYAQIPLLSLEKEIKRNPTNLAGHDADNNPFLVRLLINPRFLKKECGLFYIQYQEKSFLPDPAEFENPLFAN